MTQPAETPTPLEQEKVDLDQGFSWALKILVRKTEPPQAKHGELLFRMDTLQYYMYVCEDENGAPVKPEWVPMEFPVQPLHEVAHHPV